MSETPGAKSLLADLGRGRDPADGTMEVAGGSIAWTASAIRVELAVAGVAFSLTEASPGVAQLSRTSTRTQGFLSETTRPALHVSLRGDGGRVQLVAPVDPGDADAFLAGLPPIEGQGATATLREVRTLLHAARRLGTELAQVNVAAAAAFEREAPPARSNGGRYAVLFAAVGLLAVAGVAAYVVMAGSAPEPSAAAPPVAEQAPAPAAPASEPKPESDHVELDGLVVASMLHGDTWLNIARVANETYVLHRHEVATGRAIDASYLQLPPVQPDGVSLEVLGLQGGRVWLRWYREPLVLDPTTGTVERVRDAVANPSAAGIDDAARLSLHLAPSGLPMLMVSAEGVPTLHFEVDPQRLALFPVLDERSVRTELDEQHAPPPLPPLADTAMRFGGCARAPRDDGLLPDGRWIGAATVGGEQTVLLERGEPLARPNPAGSGDVLLPPSLEAVGEPEAAVLDLNRGAVGLKRPRLFRGCASWVVAARQPDPSQRVRRSSRGKSFSGQPRWLVPVGHAGATREALLSLFDTEDRVRWTVSLGTDGVPFVRHALIDDAGARLFVVREVDTRRSRLQALDVVTGATVW